MTETNRKRIGVPKKLWNKMSDQAKVLCCRMYDDVGRVPDNYLHPDTKPMNQKEWQVIRYNMAVTAAFALDDMRDDELAGIAKWHKSELFGQIKKLDDLDKWRASLHLNAKRTYPAIALFTSRTMNACIRRANEWAGENNINVRGWVNG